MNKTDQHIDRARKLLQPTEVELHKLPKWFEQRIKNDPVFEPLYGGCITSYMGSWVDHFGTTVRGSQELFVSEPYWFTTKDALVLDALCQRHPDMGWHLESNSWWYPGQTIRVVVYLKRP